MKVAIKWRVPVDNRREWLVAKTPINFPVCEMNATRIRPNICCRVGKTAGPISELIKTPRSQIPRSHLSTLANLNWLGNNLLLRDYYTCLFNVIIYSSRLLTSFFSDCSYRPSWNSINLPGKLIIRNLIFYEILFRVDGKYFQGFPSLLKRHWFSNSQDKKHIFLDKCFWLKNYSGFLTSNFISP